MNDFGQQSSEHSEFTGQTGMASDGMDPLLEGEGVADELDPILTDGAPPKKRTGAVVLVVVVGLAVGSLFSMHTLTKVTAAAGKSTDIEKTIDIFLNRVGGGDGTDGGETGGELVDEHQEVVAALQDDYTDHQVKDLERNPFEVVEGGGGGPAIEVGEAQRRDQFEAAAEQLRLKSVIGGSRPLANINGRIVRLNQTIPVEASRISGTVNFKVIEITRDSVTVVAEDPGLKLRVEKVIKLNRNSG